MTHFESYAESESHKIPKTPGIYCIYLNAITRRAVDLLGRPPFTQEKLESAKQNLERRLYLISHLLNSNELSGQLSDNDRAEHLSNTITLSGKFIAPSTILELVKKIPTQDVYTFVRMHESMATFTQPIYIGITYEQTLHERYDQHRNNYLNKVSGTFGGRLQAAGFDWIDILFMCKPVNQNELSRQSLEQLEIFFQYFSRPTLSKR